MKYKNLGLKQFSYLAENLAKTYRKSEINVGLIGPLGAGKTTFVKSFMRAFKVNRAKSPSFVITHLYKAGSKNIYHIDFYRLHSETQLEQLGLTEIMNGANTALIEWVDKFPKIQKLCNLIIKIKINPNGTRDVDISTTKN